MQPKINLVRQRGRSVNAQCKRTQPPSPDQHEPLPANTVLSHLISDYNNSCLQ